MAKTTRPAARIVDLTPELAAELLDRNPRNRRIRRANYATVKRAIANKEWRLNGEAIKIAADGFMLDGQHRCLAVLETGVAIRTFLIEGLDVDTQETMDTGKSRSLSDMLQIRGEKNTTKLAAIITRTYAMRRFGIKAATGGSFNEVTTLAERLAWFEANGWVRDIVDPARAVQKGARYPGSAMVGALMVAFDEIDSEDSQYFWDRLADGVELGANSPIMILRNTLKRIADDTKGQRKELYLGAITIKAWNAYRDGVEISLLKFRPGGANPETFPQPR